MARAKGEGSISQRKDGTFNVRLTVDGVTKSRYAKTKTEAKHKLDQLRAEAKRHTAAQFVDFQETLVSNYMDKFLSYKKPNLSDTSYIRLESTVNTHIKTSFRAMRMKHMTSERIQACINEKHESGLSYSSVKKIYDAFNACFKYAIVKHDIEINDNPMLAVNMVSSKNFEASRKEPRYLNKEEREAFESEALRRFQNGKPAYRLGPALIFMMNTGIREGEMAGLSWDDIDFENTSMQINKIAQTVKRQNKYMTESRDDTKWNSNRFVPLNQKALNMLDLIKEWCYEPNKNSETILYTNKYKPVPPQEITKAFNRVCKAAGITENMEGVGAHCLRHTFATTLFEHNIDAKVISELLGHSSIAVTLNTYVSVTNKMKAKAVELPKI